MGGEVVQAYLGAGSRLIPAACSVAALTAVVVYPLEGADNARLAYASCAGLAVVLLAVGLLRSPFAIGAAIALAALEYTAWLGVDSRPLDGASPLVAGGLVLSAELAYWSLAAAGPTPVTLVENVRRALTVLAITVLGAVAGFVMLAVGAAAPTNSSALAAMAAAAAVGALVLMAVLPSHATPVDSRSDRDSPR